MSAVVPMFDEAANAADHSPLPAGPPGGRPGAAA
jgi:hypothetical protein